MRYYFSRFLVACFFICYFINTQAQQLSLDEILTVHAKSESERESYLLRKGFDFEETKVEKIKDTDILARYYAWKLRNNNKNSSRTMVVTRGKYPSNLPLYETSYITFNKSDYTSLKTNALIKGFKYISSTMDVERVDHVYENEKYRLVFYTATLKSVYVYGIRVINR